jgi:hypothetical protein
MCHRLVCVERGVGVSWESLLRSLHLSAAALLVLPTAAASVSPAKPRSSVGSGGAGPPSQPRTSRPSGGRPPPFEPLSAREPGAAVVGVAVAGKRPVAGDQGPGSGGGGGATAPRSGGAGPAGSGGAGGGTGAGGVGAAAAAGGAGASVSQLRRVNSDRVLGLDPRKASGTPVAAAPVESKLRSPRVGSGGVPSDSRLPAAKPKSWDAVVALPAKRLDEVAVLHDASGDELSDEGEELRRGAGSSRAAAVPPSSTHTPRTAARPSRCTGSISGIGCECSVAQQLSVWGVGCGVWGVGCGVWGVGCGVWGVGCGVGCGYGCGRPRRF